ncbi:NAD(P)H oxidoreductase [Saccharibacillus sp. O23]|uniref:NAD(P)H-dependent oxidoreductase n=1 Tax=Saccharibacillus sp. O23 TaxID=2009338 RepID=UPI000B4E3DAE|nr:NAD(P)H-dependent oxidoreductase [Saccharibacillus sp. O23]OWR30847.1 NAD(P)H oxidoreductase [Saccharibacillus sp. O23]
MKTLVIAAHPTLEESRVNRRWLEEIRKYPEQITVSSLYEKYPDGVIDVAAEQALVEAHDRIVWQFPFYWFNCPPMMKQWLDEVLLQGWAYGPGTDVFHGKSIGVAVTAGVREEDYAPGREFRYEIGTLLRPFELTAEYVGAPYEEPFVQYGINSRTSDEEIEASAKRYAEHLLNAKPFEPLSHAGALQERA